MNIYSTFPMCQARVTRGLNPHAQALTNTSGQMLAMNPGGPGSHCGQGSARHQALCWRISPALAH